VTVQQFNLDTQQRLDQLCCFVSRVSQNSLRNIRRKFQLRKINKQAFLSWF